MSNEINKFQIDIDNLFKQNENDLSSIKELYSKLKEMDDKISQIEYIDSQLANKLKKEYESLKKQILDENVQVELSNKIEETKALIQNKVNEINEKLKSIKDTKQEVINIKEMFGAKGDNTTDDTQAFKNAINYGKNNGCTVFYLPQGKYILSDTIRIDFDGFTLIGDGNNLNGNNSTIIYRKADKTIFHVGGEATLTKYNNISNPVFKNIAFRDKSDTYTNNPFFKFHYINWLLIQDCVMSIYNAVIDCKQIYDCRIVNCDIGTGGNEELGIALITIHGGKNASLTEVGWDSANTLMIYGCKFERYRGTAIKITKEEQPSTTNTVNPNLATNVNTIRIEMSRFESPYLLKAPVFDFNSARGIYLNTQISVLDGQSERDCVVKCNDVVGMMGLLKVSYYTTSLDGATYNNFESPVCKFIKSGSINLDIHPVITNRYLLDYYIYVEANDNSYRSIDVKIPISYTKKKIYNSSSLQLNTGIQGRQMMYGESGNNGFKFRYDNALEDEYALNSQLISEKHYYRESYKQANKTTQYLSDTISDSNGTYKNNNIDNVFKGALFVGNAKPKTTLGCGVTSRQPRIIRFESAFPSTEEENVFYKVGDITFNTAPKSGEYVGWVCINAGNPGTWKGFGLIEA